MGGKQAGCIGLLAARSAGCHVLGVVAYSDELTLVAHSLRIPTWSSIRSDKAIRSLREADLLISVHGREIVSGETLALPRWEVSTFIPACTPTRVRTRLPGSLLTGIHARALACM